MVAPEYASNVFINCPFDDTYQPIFRAITFCVLDSGFTPRCAMEIDDGALVRIDKIFRIIEECKFGIHDLSRTELDPNLNLPRFNMPLELGMFLSAKHFGDKRQKDKNCLILDREQYRYQLFISDIAGHDIHEHGVDVNEVIRLVRNWLNSASKRKTIPGGTTILERYHQFNDVLPLMCEKLRLIPGELTFVDYAILVEQWLEENG